MHQRFTAAQVAPKPDAKEWDPYFAYEKRLLNLAAKDANIVREASHYGSTVEP